MSIYSSFQKVAQIVDCQDFIEQLEDLLVFMKMVGEEVDVAHDNVFDWMAMIDTDEYEDDALEEDIDNFGQFDQDDFDEIKKRLYELLGKLNSILSEFEQKTGIWIYFEYNREDYEAYFDFNANKVLDIVIELNQLKQNVG